MTELSMPSVEDTAVSQDHLTRSTEPSPRNERCFLYGYSISVEIQLYGSYYVSNADTRECQLGQHKNAGLAYYAFTVAMSALGFGSRKSKLAT